MLCIFFGDLDSSTIINGILFFSLSLFSQDKIVPRTISGSRIFFSRLWYMKFRMHFEYYTWFAVSRVVPDETFSATHPNKMQKFRGFEKQVFGIFFSWNQCGHKQVISRLIMSWDFFSWNWSGYQKPMCFHKFLKVSAKKAKIPWKNTDYAF